MVYSYDFGAVVLFTVLACSRQWCFRTQIVLKAWKLYHRLWKAWEGP